MQTSKLAVLVTGGAGYIGSHVCKALQQAGYLPITLDNLSNGHEWAVRFGPFFKGDLQNRRDLDLVFTKYQPKAVIHLASLIDLRESIRNPYSHYLNNTVGTLSLLKAMVDYEVYSLVFSSSAAVYAPPIYLPLDEEHPKGPTSPYGRTKWICEQMIEDFHEAYGLNGVCLRYFNAAGADSIGEIGEAHHPETHLIPRLLLTAQKKQSHFSIYGTDFPTRDGTAIRDFIHVSDLAEAHVKALQWIGEKKKSATFNLGTGKGYSVLEMVEKVMSITGCAIDVHYEKRQISESPELVADVKKAREQLQWILKYSDLDTIIETAWRWQNNPLLASSTV